MSKQDILKTFQGEIDTLTNVEAKKEAFRKLSFKKDWPNFHIENEKVYFVQYAGAGFDEDSNDAFVNKVKLFLKKSPRLFYIIYHFIGSSFVGTSAKQAIKNLSKGSIIVNLGSGVTSVRDDVINIDFYPFEKVDFVADIANLPFVDSSVDAVICEQVLEHVPNPKTVAKEIHRILKPGGVVYIVVPFVFSFHSSPYDYYRWSKTGLEEEFKEFTKVESGIRSGAGAAVDWVLSEYLATLFSFGSRKIHQILFMIFLIVFTPLCYLDYLTYKLPTSENIASHVYFIGRKK